MSLAVGMVTVSSPQIDNNDPSPGEARGIMPSDAVDPQAYDQRAYALGLPPLSPDYQELRVPLVIPIPYPYDDAGVTYPAGHSMVIGGLVQGFFSGAEVSFSGASGVSVINNEPQKHLWPIRIQVFGLPVGCTGTVRVTHTPGYDNVGIETDDRVWNITGANGPNVVVFDEVPISSPAAILNARWRFRWSFAGGAPTSSRFQYRALMYKGVIVPDVLPVGWTARNDTDDQRGGFWGKTNRGNAARRRFPRRAMATHPANWRFIISEFFYPTLFIRAQHRDNQNVTSRFHGSMDGQRDTVEYLPNGNSLTPNHIWIGNELFDPQLAPRSSGAGIGRVFTFNFNPFISVPLLGYTATTMVMTGFNAIISPGDRNYRFTCLSVLESNATWDYIKARFYINGVLHSTHTLTLVVGAITDTGPIIPAAPNNFCVIEMELELKASYVAFGAVVNAAFSMAQSPRIDIPLPYNCVGANNELIPGGYLPALLRAPRVAGEAAKHGTPGQTSLVFLASGGAGTAHSYCGTFLPAVTGMYRVTIDGSDLTLVLGELEFRNQARHSALCRAGKRMWFHAVTGRPANLTIGLVLMPQVQTAIPPGGLATASFLTDDTVFFGTITVPAAGTYKISNDCGTSASLLLAVSPTDPYCADYRAGPFTIIDDANRAIADPITLDFTTTGPATVYVRFETYDPFFFLSSGKPSFGGATGNITWAVVP